MTVRGKRHRRLVLDERPVVTQHEPFIRGLPKVDLHLHLVGATSPDTIVELGGSNNRTTGLFADFADFKNTFRDVTSLVRSPDDLALLTTRLGERLRDDNVRYAEVAITPNGHLKVGRMSLDGLLEGLESGRQKAEGLGVKLAWVFDLTGNVGSEGAWETARFAVEARKDGVPVVGLGLAGRERHLGPFRYPDVFLFGRDNGLHTVPHAGEFLGPLYMRNVLTYLQPDRIGHGITASRNSGVLKTLVERGIPLEVCPSSNVATGASPSLRTHPLVELVRAGATVAICSDDPALFGTTLSHEYALAAELLELDETGIKDLAVTGIRSSFLDDAEKEALVHEIHGRRFGGPALDGHQFGSFGLNR